MKKITTIILFFLPLIVSADIYKWTDSSGKLHFSDRKPQEVESGIINLSPKRELIPDLPTPPRNGMVLFQSKDDLEVPYKIKLHEVKVFDEAESSLTIDFIYTYNHEIPVDEVRLFVMPNHGYWQTSHVKISRGKNGARAIIGLSKRNMEKNNATKSKTTNLRFRFDHYQPQKYLGNIWGQDVEFEKVWRLEN